MGHIKILQREEAESIKPWITARRHMWLSWKKQGVEYYETRSQGLVRYWMESGTYSD